MTQLTPGHALRLSQLAVTALAVPVMDLVMTITPTMTMPWVAAAQIRVLTSRVSGSRVIIGWKATGIAVPCLNLSTVVTAVAVTAVAHLQEPQPAATKTAPAQAPAP